MSPVELTPPDWGAGSNEKCGKAVFADKEDPDYQTILATFSTVTEELAERARMDMNGGKPAENGSRSSQ